MAKTKMTVGVEIDGDAKGFQKAAEDAKKSTSSLVSQTGKGSSAIGGFFGKIGTSIGNFGKQIGGLAGQIASSISGAMKVLMANPIILAISAIVAAVAGLVKVFKSTDSGGTAFAARMQQIKDILDVVRQRVAALIGALGKLFSGNFKGAAEDFKKAVTGIGEAFEEAAAAGKKYQEELDRIADAESNYISQAADARNKIAKLEFDAADRTKSSAERRAALDEALRLGKEEAEAKKRFAQEKLDTEINHLAEVNGVRAEELRAFIKMTDEEQANASDAMKFVRNNNEEGFDKIEKLYADVIDADTEYYETNKRNQSKISGFIEEQAKEAEKAAEAQAKAREEEQKKVKETADIYNQITLLKLSGLDQELEALKQEKDEELSKVKDNADAKIAIEEKYRILEQQLRDKAAKDAEEKRQEEIKAEQQKKQELQSIYEQISLLKLSGLEKEQEQLNQAREKELAAVEANEAMKLAIMEKYSELQRQLDDKKIEEDKAKRQEELEEKIGQYEQYAQAVSSILGSIGQIFEAQKNRELAAAGNNAKKKEEIERKYAKKQQSIAIVQAVISTALAVTKALNTQPFLPMGPIMAAVALAAGLAQIATIKSQKFAKGGLVYGQTLATVGEYANAGSNPEVISPLDKLKKLIGENSGQVTFRIEGDALVGVLDKYERKQLSYR